MEFQQKSGVLSHLLWCASFFADNLRDPWPGWRSGAADISGPPVRRDFASSSLRVRGKCLLTRARFEVAQSTLVQPALKPLCEIATVTLSDLDDCCHSVMFYCRAVLERQMLFVKVRLSF